jgi:Rod binding domain-containing protein
MIEGLKAPSEAASQAAGPKRKEIVDTATQFESLLIAQMLKSMREAGGSAGWLGSGEDSTSASAMELAEEHFAAALAKQGGLGLTKLITQGLAAEPRNQ